MWRGRLKRRMATRESGQRGSTTFVELVAPPTALVPTDCRTGRTPVQTPNSLEGCFGFISGNLEPGAGGVCVLIQITGQLSGARKEEE
jgi:hypothetical protein